MMSRVQDAGEPAHLAIHPLLILALLPHLSVPVIVSHVCFIVLVTLGSRLCILMQLICRMHVSLLNLQFCCSCLYSSDRTDKGMLKRVDLSTISAELAGMQQLENGTLSL